MGIGMLPVTKFDLSLKFQICLHMMSRSQDLVSAQQPQQWVYLLTCLRWLGGSLCWRPRWFAEHVLQRSGPPRRSWWETQSFIDARDVAFGLQGRAFEHICVPKSLKKTCVPVCSIWVALVRLKLLRLVRFRSKDCSDLWLSGDGRARLSG